MVHTDTPVSPWFVVESHIKKHARLNMISHLLSSIPYQEVELDKVELPKRPQIGNYKRPSRDLATYVPDFAAALLGDSPSRLFDVPKIRDVEVVRGLLGLHGVKVTDGTSCGFAAPEREYAPQSVPEKKYA